MAADCLPAKFPVRVFIDRILRKGRYLLLLPVFPPMLLRHELRQRGGTVREVLIVEVHAAVAGCNRPERRRLLYGRDLLAHAVIAAPVSRADAAAPGLLSQCFHNDGQVLSVMQAEEAVAVAVGRAGAPHLHDGDGVARLKETLHALLFRFELVPAFVITGLQKKRHFLLGFGKIEVHSQFRAVVAGIIVRNSAVFHLYSPFRLVLC